MKTIKIFLASSEELDYDRMAFGNLVRRLDDMYEKRGIRIKLFEWEDYDAAFNDRRKQDEYNDHVRKSDIFLALFHKKAGKFTIEEFDIASEEFKQHASPKVFTFCKDLQPGEEESTELVEFKKQLFEEMGHYWCRYDTRESLQLQFVMQLQLVESTQMGELKVEDGNVTMDGIRIATMDKLRFAAANEDYQKMQTEMFELQEEIEGIRLDLEKKKQKLEKKRAKLEKDPEDEEYQEEYKEVKEEVEELVGKLQPKLDKYNKLKEDYEQCQQLLFNTAKRVAQMQGERITERMRRAMDAFSEGKVREANIILDEAEADAKRNFEDYKQSKEITELKRQAVLSSIEELMFKASTEIADTSRPIKERIEQTKKIYAQADEMAQECDYEKNKYIKLLFEYERFLRKYSFYKESKSVILRLLDLCKNTYGEEHSQTATAYSALGMTQRRLGENKDVLDYYNKALEIRERILDKNDPELANSYTNIGTFYMMEMKDYPKAMDYLMKGLAIREKIFGPENASTVNSYSTIGLLYRKMGDYAKSLEFYEKALVYREKCLGVEHPSTAISYQNLGNWYRLQGMYDKALEFYKKAWPIIEKAVGLNHRRTAILYSNMGLAYNGLGKYDEALDWHMKALEIRKAIYGPDHPEVALSFNNIGRVYRNMKEYDKALGFCKEGLLIREKRFGEEHPKTAGSYESIAKIHKEKGDNIEALKWAERAMKADPNNSEIISLLGTIYQSLGRYEEALVQFESCLKLKQEKNASEKSIKETEEKIKELKKLMEG